MGGFFRSCSQPSIFSYCCLMFRARVFFFRRRWKIERLWTAYCRFLLRNAQSTTTPLKCSDFEYRYWCTEILVRILPELHCFLLDRLYFTYVIHSSQQEKERPRKTVFKNLASRNLSMLSQTFNLRTPDRNITALTVGPQPPKAFGGGWGGRVHSVTPYLLSIHSTRERDCIPIGSEHGKMSCSSLNRHVVSRSVVVLKVCFCIRDLASNLLR